MRTMRFIVVVLFVGVLIPSVGHASSLTKLDTAGLDGPGNVIWVIDVATPTRVAFTGLQGASNNADQIVAYWVVPSQGEPFFSAIVAWNGDDDSHIHTAATGTLIDERPEIGSGDLGWVFDDRLDAGRYTIVVAWAADHVVQGVARLYAEEGVLLASRTVAAGARLYAARDFDGIANGQLDPEAGATVGGEVTVTTHGRLFAMFFHSKQFPGSQPLRYRGPTEETIGEQFILYGAPAGTHAFEIPAEVRGPKAETFLLTTDVPGPS